MLELRSIRSILPAGVCASVDENLDMDKLWEIRLRAGKPVTVRYNGREYFLTHSGLSDDDRQAVMCSAEDVRSSVLGAAEHSVYAYNDDINRGYMTLFCGVRLGICGEVVSDGGKILAVKNYSSVNIRIPHEIFGISRCIMSEIVGKLENILILAPPGGGKTTVLRDLARRFSDEGGYDVLIADERAEIACCHRGMPGMDVGKRTDVITGSTKRHAFECALRSSRPDVIVTDELFGDDAEIVKEAVGCGITVVASAHSSSPEMFRKRRLCSALADAVDKYYFLCRAGDVLEAKMYEGKDIL